MALFKYRPVDKNSLNILINDELYFATSSQFNDPFDSQLSPSEYIQSFESLGMNDQASELVVLEKTLQKRFEIMGIYCLSSHDDNLLMWSHYGDSHKGICFGFRNDLHYYVRTDGPVSCEEVDYLNPGEHVYTTLYMALNSGSRFHDDEFVNSIKKRQALFKTAFTKKHKNWEYEQEVRLLCDDSGILKFNPLALESVTFGMRISEQDKETVLTLLTLPKWSHVKVYQAKAKGLELALEIETC
ncbi:DUF2971 domain-containing protein [Photobacterium sanctipauli]|uniref:DUF2971 domain-containing protein n=1 Tax=Photobacterium sanctipauli TaxID=1342794 RepID=A0A2T3NIG2_9GAMM|nr:DUF2971 domain-containing protein [Photobacterium sanctipauli]PSW14799.1 DUF2971 domain-containing protein [Photobacterium sanctipauli]